MKINAKYQCVLFLKDKDEIKLLKPTATLYGHVTEASKTIFLTPYKPPFNIMEKMGEFSVKPDRTSELININRHGTKYAAMIYSNGNWIDLPVKLVYCKDLYARTPFKDAEMQNLLSKRVLIFGAGTGGGNIAPELARAGVGGITISDPDILGLANISRHEGCLLDVGKPKVQVAAERVFLINPSIKIMTYNENIFDRSFKFIKDLFLMHDLVIASTDIVSIQMTINELAHKLKIPCVFGGCYEEAMGGEVFFTLPNENMPCLSCLRDGLKQPEKSNEIDYSTAKGIEDYKGEPGLHAMVDFVTCVEVLICIAMLLRDSKDSKLAKLIDPAKNFLLIGGHLTEGVCRFKKPFHIFYEPLKGRREDCYVCGTRKLQY